MTQPADLYLALQDDGAPVDTAPARRLGALLLAVLLLAAVPVTWASAEALGVTPPAPAFAKDDDGDDDGDDPSSDDGTVRGQGTATQSRSATVTGATGVSTKPQTATASKTATRTKNTGVSTKPQTATLSRDATRTKNTGVSTKA